jgi:hypothetical protein
MSDNILQQIKNVLNESFNADSMILDSNKALIEQNPQTAAYAITELRTDYGFFSQKSERFEAFLQKNKMSGSDILQFYRIEE